MKEAPFVFGKIALEQNFTDREKEATSLVAYFKSLVNTIIISPRRWGKSSLVNKASKLAMSQDNKLCVCNLDLFNIKNERNFYELLAQKVLSATSSRVEEIIGNVKKFFSRLSPRLSFSSDNISLSFTLEELQYNSDEVLDLAEKIAREKGIKIVICIDEFQNIVEFDEPAYFQKHLRAHWQRHQHVAYCLYGSKRSMMVELFESTSKPFYKFGNILFLDKIASKDLVKFFITRFEDTDKTITKEAAILIAELVDNHPYYAQQLAQLSWFRTEYECTKEIVYQAHEALVEQLSLLFTNITETLTKQQIYYLKALCAGEKAITSTQVMHHYGISSPTSANRSKLALIKNDILDNNAGKISFQDPIYAYWLKTYYFSSS